MTWQRVYTGLGKTRNESTFVPILKPAHVCFFFAFCEDPCDSTETEDAVGHSAPLKELYSAENSASTPSSGKALGHQKRKWGFPPIFSIVISKFILAHILLTS